MIISIAVAAGFAQPKSQISTCLFLEAREQRVDKLPFFVTFARASTTGSGVRRAAMGHKKQRHREIAFSLRFSGGLTFGRRRRNPKRRRAVPRLSTLVIIFPGSVVHLPKNTPVLRRDLSRLNTGVGGLLT